jgi:hypothetical protein
MWLCFQLISRESVLGEPAQYPLPSCFRRTLWFTGWSVHQKYAHCRISRGVKTSLANNHLSTIKEGLVYVSECCLSRVDPIHFLPMPLLRKTMTRGTLSLIKQRSEYVSLHDIDACSGVLSRYHEMFRVVASFRPPD